jgi:hypothetical protein
MRHPHREQGGSAGERCDARPAACLLDHAAEDLPERRDPFGADVEEPALVVVERLEAGVRQVLGVDELVPVLALAHHPDLAPLVDELEEDREQAEAALVDDGGRAQQHRVEAVAVAEQDALRLQLGAAVDLDGTGGLLLRDGLVEVGRVDAVRRGEDEPGHAVPGRALGEPPRSLHVRPPEVVLVLHRVGEDGRAVEDRVVGVRAEDLVQRALVEEVAAHTHQPLVARGVRLEVDAHAAVALRQQAAFQDVAEEAGAAGDEVGAAHRFMAGSKRTSVMFSWYCVCGQSQRLRSSA